MRRIRLSLSGEVQGIGLRPSVHRAAVKCNISGFVVNTSEGVLIEAEGLDENLEKFLRSLPVSSSKSMHDISCVGSKKFTINKSKINGTPKLSISPDRGICSTCLKEFYDKNNRRYLYPFISCVDCGPRYSITCSLPFDREKTTLKPFNLCSDCLSDYSTITNRRYHAQTINCSKCGPKLSLLSPSGKSINKLHCELAEAISVIEDGGCIAVKGIGGFHLVVDASNDNAVKRLKQIKSRANKPFAMMARDLIMAKRFCKINSLEEHILISPAAPIVIVDSIKNQKTIGLFLAYTAVHDYILNNINKPLLVTSANMKNQPILITDHDIISTFGDKIDLILTHNRPIANPCDDSVGRCIGNKFRLFRRARGYNLLFSKINHEPLIGLGGHGKSTFAINTSHGTLLSPHIGTLDSLEMQDRFSQVKNNLENMIHVKSSFPIGDLNPDYAVNEIYDAKIKLQHHESHFAACLFENKLNNNVCGHVWDGTGYGEDQTVWGGETFKLSSNSIRRIASLLPFRLLGNEQAIRDTRRIAWVLLRDTYQNKKIPEIWQKWLNKNLSKSEQANFSTMHSKSLNSPICSSIGRLFDGIASLLNVSMVNTYDGESAMMLENLAFNKNVSNGYQVNLFNKKNLVLLDWRSLIVQIAQDIEQGCSYRNVATKFHCWLADSLVCLSQVQSHKNIILTGGVFQNKLLTELAVGKLEYNNYQVFLNEKIPCNDGGLSIGQLKLHTIKSSELLCV